MVDFSKIVHKFSQFNYAVSPTIQICKIGGHRHKANELKGHQSELAFFILPTHSGVTLQIRQGDFANFPDPEKIFHECLQGWRTVSKDLIATCLQAP